MLKPDSLIFDMDGTLWDASETYTAAWNEGFKIMNIDRIFSRGDLDYMMGWERRRLLEHTFPDYPEEKQESALADVPFIFVDYGFGQTEKML